MEKGNLFFYDVVDSSIARPHALYFHLKSLRSLISNGVDTDLLRTCYGLGMDLIRTWKVLLRTRSKKLKSQRYSGNLKSKKLPSQDATKIQRPKNKDQQSTQHQTHSRRAQGGCWGSLNGPLRATDADRYSARRSVQ